jgi:hypothetical protein
MSLCILAGGKLVTVAATLFTLSWNHSVQKTEWRETWAVMPDGLEIREAGVKGSGAGMEPGEDARLRDGWWVWHPALPPQPSLTLAASGATGGGWLLCHERGCLTIGATSGEAAVLSSCP